MALRIFIQRCSIGLTFTGGNKMSAIGSTGTSSKVEEKSLLEKTIFSLFVCKNKKGIKIKT